MPHKDVSVEGDSSSHGCGTVSDSIATKTYFNNTLISLLDCSGSPCCHGSSHEWTASQGSTRVFIEGKSVHRIEDGRSCGGMTVGPQRTLHIND